MANAGNAGSDDGMGQIFRALDDMVVAGERRQTYDAQIGDGLGNVTTDRQGMVWARVTTDRGTTLHKVRCYTARPVHGAYVKVRKSPDDGVMEVTRPDFTIAEAFYDGSTGTGVASVPDHGGSHSGPQGLDVVWVQALQIVPGLVRPADTPDLTVYVELFHVRGANPGFSATQTVDLTSYVPGVANTSILVLICYDYETGLLTVIEGPTRSGGEFPWEGGAATFSDADIPPITVPRLTVPLAAVQLDNGATAIAWDKIFRDLRDWVTVPDWGDIRTNVEDTAFDFLEGKLIAGGGITLTPLTDGNGVVTLLVSGSGGSGGVAGSWNPDAAAVPVDAMDDEFPGSAVDGKWTEYDPGTQQTPAVGSGVLTLDQTDQYPNGYATGEYQALPAGDFTIVVKCKLSAVILDEPDGKLAAGIAIWEDASDQTKPLYVFGLVVGATGAGFGYMRFSDFDTYVTRSVDINTVTIDTYYYVRLRRSGTTYFLDVSEDGFTFGYTKNVTTAITSILASTDHVGPAMVLQDSKNLTATFEFFRYRDVADDLDAPVYGAIDLFASEIQYIPGVLADWDGSADPGNVDDALDQLAERTTDIEDFTTLTNAQQIQGREVESAAPTDDDVLTWDNAGAEWRAKAPTYMVPVCLSNYVDRNERNLDQHVHGGLDSIATAQAVSSGSPINVTVGLGKVLIIVNAGADTAGTLTVTGTTVDRDTGAETGADTDDLTIAGTSTDSSSTDAEGNVIHGFSNAYITSKWFKGDIAISTADVDLSDVDIWIVTFEQFNDCPLITVQTLDATLSVTNVNAWVYIYLYAVEVTGDTAVLSLIGTVALPQADSVANLAYRLREGLIAKALDGATDGIFVDVHFGPAASTYVQFFTLKIWAELTFALTLT